MPAYNIIEGPKLYRLMKKLIADQTLVKLSVPRTAYERLTVITRMLPEKAPLYFCIDPPQGVITAIKRRSAKTLDFEFTGQDQVKHRFDAQLQSDLTADLTLHLPQQIQRIQQRENVRVDPGINSNLLLDLEGRPVALAIENISAGGALCSCPNIYKPLIEVGQQWSHVPMELVMGMGITHVAVGRLKVLRKMAGYRPKHFELALAFLQISRHAHQKLLHFINACQREMLQNRHK